VNDQRFWRIERAAGFLLVVGFVANLAGVLMFTIRGGTGGGTPPSHTFFVWERSFFMAAVVLTTLGFVLLEGHLQNTDGRVLARTGATTYLFAGILLVAAEGLTLSAGLDENRVLALLDIYVVLAFLAQAAIGGALLQSGLLATWIGWVTILWNLGCLIVLPVITPGDIYFPILHHLMPLLIGSALLWRAQ
jgi:hypothetical protein